MRPKDALEPTKQDGVVYKIPCECRKVHIGETGKAMQDRIKEHDRDIRLARTQTSAVSEHANETGHLPIWKEVKFIDRDPHWYTRRVKEAIHIRLHPDNINRDSGIEIPEAWIPTIRKHNSRPTTKRTCEGTTSNSRNNNEDRNALIAANHHATNSDVQVNNRPHRLMKTSSIAVETSRSTTQSDYIVRQTNKRSSYLSYTMMNHKHIVNDTKYAL